MLVWVVGCLGACLLGWLVGWLVGWSLDWLVVRAGVCLGVLPVVFAGERE